MSRTLVIGDIHGGLKALQQVMLRAEVSGNDKLIFLGDYVDGWSESAEVVEFLIALSTRQTCYFIRGNHDEWCEDWLRTGDAEKTWLFHGGQATAKSYMQLDEAKLPQHLHFFETLLPFLIDDENRLYIHAGFVTVKGPAEDLPNSNYCWDRTLWEMAVALERGVEPALLWLPQRLQLFSEIFIGHTPTLYYDITVPMHAANIWNVDTGAAFTGCLSVMDVHTKQYWQSDPVETLYPGEPGRNKR